jgi:hypothetical protein
MRALSTGWARLIRCQIDGRRRHCGVLAEPVPRRISTARPASRRTVLTVVTVRGEQRTTDAMVALVAAQCLPLA